MKYVLIAWGLGLTYSSSTIESLAYICAPYNFDDICFIYPMTVGTILALDKKYDISTQLLTIDRSFIIQRYQLAYGEDFDINNIPTPLEYLMMSCEIDNEFLLELKNAFLTFIREEVTILISSCQIVIGSPLDKRIIDNDNFSDFQNVVRLQNKIAEVAKIPENESERAKHFREKRELRDAVKRKQQGANAPSFLDLMSAMCAYGVGITPLNIKDMSLFALYHQLNVNGSKERYNTEMHFLYGGADPKKLKPQYWITNNNQ